jgi:hypothetical protein
LTEAGAVERDQAHTLTLRGVIEDFGLDAATREAVEVEDRAAIGVAVLVVGERATVAKAERTYRLASLRLR